ncbi:hypothetical protein BGZ75_001845, partial [Mortierella antarctica]
IHLNAQIKAAKEYEKICALTKDSSYGGNRGRGRYRNSFRNGYSTNKRILLRYNTYLLTPTRVIPMTTKQDTSQDRIQRGHRGRGRGRAQKQQ